MNTDKMTETEALLTLLDIGSQEAEMGISMSIEDFKKMMENQYTKDKEDYK